MTPKRIRIFLTSAPIATMYMGIYARNTWEKGIKDVLIIDALELKPTQKQYIRQAAKIHRFALVKDFSAEKDENSSPVPSQLKQLTRRLKTRRGIKRIYNFLYFYKKKQEVQQHKRQILKGFGDNFFGEADVSLYMQPVLHLNEPLREMFPEAEVCLFEHGLGDYLDLENKLMEGDKFHCIFYKGLQQILHQRYIRPDFIHPALPEHGFEEASKKFTKLFPQIKKIKPAKKEQRKLALIALQSLEEFMIPVSFWSTFFDLCIRHIEHPREVHFLLKPHPRQSPEVLEDIIMYFEEKELSYEIWDNPGVRSISLELIFHSWKESIHYVFSPFSSSVFYLSELYPEKHIRYFYSIKVLKPFLQSVPDLYIRRWEKLQEYVDTIFGRNVIQMSSEPSSQFFRERVNSK